MVCRRPTDLCFCSDSRVRRMFSPFRHVARTLAPISSLSLISCPSSCIITRHAWQRQTRTYAAIPPTALKPTHSIYVSSSTNPYFNLTLEDWCVLLFFLGCPSQREGMLTRATVPSSLVQALPLPPSASPAPASVQRLILCRHWAQPEPLERS